jgi:hypothetical protein
VPYLAGGMLLSGLADRLPRRTVMIACGLRRWQARHQVDDQSRRSCT